jgi:hypothetical protein
MQDGVRRESESRVECGALSRYELDAWRDRFGIVAGVTGREADFRITASRPDESAQDGAAGLGRLTAALDGFDSVAASRQRHGAEIVVHEKSSALWLGDGFDGHVTRRPGLLLAVTVADCIPVYLAHPSTGTVALLHAGWRGTAAGIVEQGIRAVCNATVGGPSEIIMHCGIGICGACYEVGHEVRQAVGGERRVSGNRLDLRRALADRARAVGVTEVTVSSWCSAHDHDRFHSHRLSGGRDGRMAAYLGQPVG